MKTAGIIVVVILIAAVLGTGIFFMTRNVQQGNANNNPVTNTGTNSNSNVGTGTAATTSQLNALASSSDPSEPDDSATGIDTNVVDSSGLN
jgi:cytoskeletal protein RodZ